MTQYNPTHTRLIAQKVIDTSFAGAVSEADHNDCRAKVVAYLSQNEGETYSTEDRQSYELKDGKLYERDNNPESEWNDWAVYNATDLSLIDSSWQQREIADDLQNAVMFEGEKAEALEQLRAGDRTVPFGQGGEFSLDGDMLVLAINGELSAWRVDDLKTELTHEQITQGAVAQDFEPLDADTVACLNDLVGGKMLENSNLTETPSINADEHTPVTPAYYAEHCNDDDWDHYAADGVNHTICDPYGNIVVETEKPDIISSEKYVEYAIEGGLFEDHDLSGKYFFGDHVDRTIEGASVFTLRDPYGNEIGYITAEPLTTEIDFEQSDEDTVEKPLEGFDFKAMGAEFESAAKTATNKADELEMERGI